MEIALNTFLCSPMNRPRANSQPVKPATSNAKTVAACRTNSAATTTTTAGTTRTRRAVATTNAHPTCGHAQIRAIAFPSGNFAMAPTTARTGPMRRHAVGEMGGKTNKKKIVQPAICAQHWAANRAVEHRQMVEFARAHRDTNLTSVSSELAQVEKNYFQFFKLILIYFLLFSKFRRHQWMLGIRLLRPNLPKPQAQLHLRLSWLLLPTTNGAKPRRWPWARWQQQSYTPRLLYLQRSPKYAPFCGPSWGTLSVESGE